ncbi:IclR family transcriptional regulator [Halomicrococcus sp. NG-SE-24]|uniref:IclR family transcriptional regulator n=1 Tax=Halomicrococcus sp. NG-SE-24 TaxID=3436928 RepID=UPI003D959EE1
MSHPPNSVVTVEKTLSIIEYLRKADTASISEVASELDLAKSTVHRHLSTLKRSEYVIKKPEGYALSLKFLDLGEFTRTRDTVYQLAEETVVELATETDERAQFLVEEHGQAVYVYRANGSHAVTADTHIGKRIPIHASAAGLAILSELPTDRIETIIDQHGLESLTNETITEPDELYSELEEIRERGFSINDQGYIEGLRAIGAPVLDKNGTVIGGLSISGPINRFRGEWFEEELPSLLLGATNELELNIAFR